MSVLFGAHSTFDEVLDFGFAAQLEEGVETLRDFGTNLPFSLYLLEYPIFVQAPLFGDLEEREGQWQAGDLDPFEDFGLVGYGSFRLIEQLFIAAEQLRP